MTENMTNINKVKIYVDNCSFVKTVLMLIVVLYHSILFWGGNWFSAIEPAVVYKPVGFFAGWLSTFHVYGFVLTSGYLYSYLRFENNKYLHFGYFLKNKTLRLIIPYVFISAVWAIPIGQIFYHLSVKEIVDKYILGLAPSQLWFLLMLFWVFVIIWPFSNHIHKSFLFSFVLSLILFSVGFVGDHYLHNYFQLWTGCNYVVFFVLGMKLRDSHCNHKFLNIRWYFLLLLLIIDVILYVLKDRFFQKEGMLFTIADTFLGLLLNVLGALLAFYILQAVAVIVRCERIRNNKWYMQLSNSSMIIYLFHQQLIYIFISIFNNWINPILLMFINFLLAITLSCVIARLFSLNRLLCFLVGEKFVKEKKT